MLDEAIEHAREKAIGDTECAKEHAQLVRWLKELKMWRNIGQKHNALNPTGFCMDCYYFTPNTDEHNDYGICLRFLDPIEKRKHNYCIEYLGDYDTI